MEELLADHYETMTARDAAYVDMRNALREYGEGSLPYNRALELYNSLDLELSLSRKELRAYGL